MKNIKKSLLLFMSCLSVLLLISCGGEDKESPVATGSQPAMGRYVEKTLKYPDDVNEAMAVTAVKKSNGSLDLFMYLEQSPYCVLYNTSDGTEYEKFDVPWYEELIEMQYYVRSIAYDSNDNEYLLVWTEDADKVYKVTADNKLEEIQMEWVEWKESPSEELSVSASEMIIASNGDLLLSQTGNGIVQYSSDGKFKSCYGDGYNRRFTSSGESLFIIDENSSQIIVYDLNTYEQKTTVNYDNMTEDAILTQGSEGSIYLTDRSGVYRLTEGGSLWEKIIEGELTSLSLPSMYSGGVIETKPGEFYMLFADPESNSSIFKYEYDESVSTIPSTELTVYTLMENDTLRQATGEFQRKNPDIRVNIMVGIDNDSSMTKEDAIKALNTEIIAGKGPDLILLDGMNVDSYIQKKVLADLSGVVKEVNESGEKLMDSMINVYEDDSKIFAVPAKFNAPSMWIDEEYAESIKNLKDLAEFAKSHNDKKVVPFSSYRDLLEIFSLSSGVLWLDEDGNLNEKSMAEFLVYLKEIYDSGMNFTDRQVEDEKKDEKEDEGRWGYGGVDPMSKDIAKSMGSESSVFDWAFGRSYTYCSNLKGYNSISAPFLAVSERNGGVVMPLPGLDEDVFIPVNVIGINAKTEKPDIAEEFVKVMLSSSVQDARIYDGFPINLKSLEHGAEGKGTEDLYFGITNTVESEQGNILIEEDLSGPMPPAEELKKVMDMCLKLKTPYVPNDTLLEMIIDETEEYFTGDETVEQAVSKIKERTKLYLSE